MMRTHSFPLVLASLLSFGTLILKAQAADPRTEASEAAPDDQELAEAKTKRLEVIESFGWTRTGKAKIGSNAELEMTDGLQLTGAAGAKKFLQISGNIASGRDLAILTAADLSWWASFQFEAEGYVKDDDKDKIDADAILTAHREGQDQANAQRVKQGLEALTITGWAVPPFYNQESKVLEYGLRIAAKGKESEGESVNYNTKLLGRRGYMDVNLVCDPAQLESSLAALRQSLKGFNFVTGETYAEYRKGDKVSEYGVAALLGAGTLAVAAKTGLLAKLWKPIALGCVALVGAVKKLWNKLTGRGNV